MHYAILKCFESRSCKRGERELCGGHTLTADCRKVEIFEEMYRFFISSGVSGWLQMGGVTVGRVPSAVAAAAVLATAATSVGFSDRLHPVVSPIVYHAANPCLPTFAKSSSVSLAYTVRPLPFESSVLIPASFTISANSWSSSSFYRVQGASILSPTSSSYSNSEVWPFPRLRCPWLKGKSYPSCPTLCKASPLSSQLWRDKVQRRLSEVVVNASPMSTFAAVVHSSRPGAPPSPEKIFDAFDHSSHLARILSSFASSPVHPYRSTIRLNSLHRWHTPSSRSLNSDEVEISTAKKPRLTVVLLGWLGSQQKHLKKYAEWYNARGIDAVTFTLPMSDVLSLSMGGRAEEQVERLTDQLSTWLSEESIGVNCPKRQLIFHTFSNTGWLTYGVVLENLSSAGNDWVERIKGCVVDSAPAAELDPRVWACGFSAALMKKRSSVSNGDFMLDSGISIAPNAAIVKAAQPLFAESALLALLEKFFSLFLRIPSINQRLSEVVTVLAKQQPACPQLYIYSTADKVIPVKLVESFMEKQRQQGRVVWGCNFQSSPHVDHFRTFPEIYGNQVTTFLEECLQKTSPKPT